MRAPDGMYDIVVEEESESMRTSLTKRLRVESLTDSMGTLFTQSCTDPVESLTDMQLHQASTVSHLHQAPAAYSGPRTIAHPAPELAEGDAEAEGVLLHRGRRPVRYA